MHVVVVNRITLSVPVEEVVADIKRVMPPIFAGLEGFVGQTLVKTRPQELVVIGRWASAEAAAAGAAVVGPGRSTPGSRRGPRDRTAWWDR